MTSHIDIMKFAGGKLGPDERQRALSHLDACSDCRAALNRALTAERMLAGDVTQPTQAEREHMFDAVLAAVEPRPAPAPRWLPFLVPAAAAIAVVLIVMPGDERALFQREGQASKTAGIPRPGEDDRVFTTPGGENRERMPPDLGANEFRERGAAKERSANAVDVAPDGELSGRHEELRAWCHAEGDAAPVRADQAGCRPEQTLVVELLRSAGPREARLSLVDASGREHRAHAAGQAAEPDPGSDVLAPWIELTDVAPGVAQVRLHLCRPSCEEDEGELLTLAVRVMP